MPVRSVPCSPLALLVPVLLGLAPGLRAWTPEEYVSASRKMYRLWTEGEEPSRDRLEAWKLAGRLVEGAREDLAAWRDHPVRGPGSFLGRDPIGDMRNLNLVHSDYFRSARGGMEAFDLETLAVAAEHPVTRMVWALADRALLRLSRRPLPPDRELVEESLLEFRKGLDLAERELGPASPFLVPLLERQAGWLRGVSGEPPLYRELAAPSSQFRRMHILGRALELLHRARGVRGEQVVERHFSVLPAVRALIHLYREADSFRAVELPQGADLHAARSKDLERSRAYLDAWLAQARWACIQGQRKRAEELFSRARKLVVLLEGSGSYAEGELLVRWADALFWGPRQRTLESMEQDCRRALPLLHHAWELRVALRVTRDEEASQLLLRWSQTAEAAGLPDERANVEWKRYDLAVNMGWGKIALPRSMRRVP